MRSWTRHHAYEPTLWIWIRDDGKGVPAALGIAEFDHTVGEGSLEWIQTLPEYHGQGLGTALVLELLRRLQDRAEFVTVSGEVNNQQSPTPLPQVRLCRQRCLVAAAALAPAKMVTRSTQKLGGFPAAVLVVLRWVGAGRPVCPLAGINRERRLDMNARELAARIAAAQRFGPSKLG